MIHVGKQWIARGLALCVVGPICAGIGSGVIAPDGSQQTTLLTGDAILSSLMSLFMVLGLVMLLGIAVGRLVDRREGILGMAFVLGWVAWTSGRMGEVFRVSAESGALMKLAVEGALVTMGVLIALSLMTDPEKGGAQGQGDDVSRFDMSSLKSSMMGVAGLGSMGAALVASIVIAMLFGRTDLAGQAVGVGFFAGIAAGVVGTLVATSAKKNDPKAGPTPFAPIMVGVMLCSVILPIFGMFYPGGSELLGLVNQGSLPGILTVSPIAWVMGALLGVPVGHSWVEHSAQQASGAGARA